MSGCVGYYVHHVGSGHRHRAVSLAAELARRGVSVTGLSSLVRPDGWTGDWLRLERDDHPAPAASADVTAGGQLHWVPLRHRGLARRSAQLSAWLVGAEPDVLVSDVSQEVTMLTRLHGVPVVSVLQPGRRDDPAHLLGLRVSTGVAAFWPQRASGMSPGLPDDVARRVRLLGGLSRYRSSDTGRGAGATNVVVLAGTGGGAEQLAAAAAAARAALPGSTWRVLGVDSWVRDPFPLLCEADLVLTHAGQNAVAEVAAARVPAIVVPQVRPHAEQLTTGSVLRGADWPALVVDDPEPADWATLVPRAVALDGGLWSRWVDGGAAGRFADLVESVMRGAAT